MSFPRPIVGEGRVGGVPLGTALPHSSTPTPDPSPKGGGEQGATMRNCRAMGRTDRAPPQAARPAYFHDSGATGHHGESGEAPRGLTACSIKGDFRSGAHA